MRGKMEKREKEERKKGSEINCEELPRITAYW
jgi:hypothetical protein